jgi:long-chain acyl-CoA synthetase
MAGPAVLTVADTIANSFLLAVQTRGDRPAIREKKFGIWQPTSWREWLQISKEIAHALHAVGFRPGDVASIMANAVPEWVLPIWAFSAPAAFPPASTRLTPPRRSNI